MGKFKWIIVAATARDGFRHSFFIGASRDDVSPDVAIAYEYNNLDDALAQIVKWNRNDLENGCDVDDLVKFPYVVIPHPDSVINFVRDQLVEKHYDDIPF